MEKNQHENISPHTREERVGLLAFQLWEEQGKPDGKEEEHWYLACKIIDGEAAGETSEALPTWLNRGSDTAGTQADKPAVVQELNHKHQRRSAA